MSYHRPSYSTVPTLPSAATYRGDSFEGRVLSTERRSQALARLYQTIRDFLPDLPPFSSLQSEEQLLTLVKDSLAVSTSHSKHREALLQARETDLEKAFRRVELKQQLLDSKVREVELHRNKLLSMRKETAGRQFVIEELENRAELFPFETDLETQLTAESNQRLRHYQEEIKARELRLQSEIRQFQEDQSQYNSELRLFSQRKLALETSEAAILRDQETASMQLALVDEKLAELTDIKERQERKLRVREEQVRLRESEITRKEGVVRDEQKQMQEQRTDYELKLAEMKRKILKLEAELENQTQGDLLGSFENIEKLREDLRLRSNEAMEHLRIKEKELTQREKVLNALASSLAEEQRCLQLEKVAVIQSKSESKPRNVLNSVEQIAMMREDIGSQAQRLEDYAEWLVTREAELETWKSSISEDKECIESSTVMLEELQAEIEQQRVELEQEREKMKAEGLHIATAMKKLKSATRDMEEQTRTLKAREQLLIHSEEMLSQRKISLEQLEKALDLREAAFQEEERPSLHPVDYLTPRDVITPRSSTGSAVFF